MGASNNITKTKVVPTNTAKRCFHVLSLKLSLELCSDTMCKMLLS